MRKVARFNLNRAEKGVKECNMAPGVWHLTRKTVDELPPLALPPSPPSGGDRPVLNEIECRLVDAIKLQGPGLVMPSLSTKKHFELNERLWRILLNRLTESTWVSRGPDSNAYFTTWPPDFETPERQRRR